MFRTGDVEKINRGILCSVTFIFRKSCRLWVNVGKYGTAGYTTDENIIRRMRLWYWITKATDTHSEYVIIFIAFPLQQWLRERALMFRYNSIACLLPVNKNVIVLVWVMKADFSWFEIFAVSWMLYDFFWIIPRCLNFICFSCGVFRIVENFTSVTSTINQQMHLYNFHLKHLKPLRHISIFSDHHQGFSSFLAKVITYSRCSSFL